MSEVIKEQVNQKASESSDAFPVSTEGLEDTSDPSQLMISLDGELGRQIAKLVEESIRTHSGRLPEGSIIQQSASYRGPLPPPSLLGGYGNVDASFPDRIVRMAESGVAHSQAMDRESIALNDRERQRYYDVVSAKDTNKHKYRMAGILSATCIVFVALIGFFVMVALDKEKMAWLPLSILVPVLTGGAIGFWKSKSREPGPDLEE